eukprot:gnl/TRDRNA2_/TRDRNA2_194582_c0_seq1.p1 gnl/TRDRNA2_/TRDRNA2_194582_c0~~gnl/TRDRNA2_/TRDRNA2_194582_c0_seq1.p1  ORF type:complete len:141 (+),score=21.80 gnl/TRDRNA2_/TRDRNA2_194582_c0_seq1:68-490(+)
MQSFAGLLFLLLLVGPTTASRWMRKHEVDPTCTTGRISLDRKVCCASYCGECADYPTCEDVHGQASKSACCKSAVQARECIKGAEAKGCLKKCSKGLPPCVMDEVVVKIPTAESRSAKDDANTAVADWHERAAAAISPSE